MDLPSPAPLLLVAVSSDARSLRLLHAAFWLARERGIPWAAVHVSTPIAPTSQEQNQVRAWMQEAVHLGAEPEWIRAATVPAGLLQALRQRQGSTLVLGRKPRTGILDLNHPIAAEIHRRSPETEVVQVPLEPPPVRTPLFPPRQEALGAFFGSLLILMACTLLASILPPGFNLPAIFLLFLAGTAIITKRWGRAFGIGSCLVSGAIFNFFFVAPHRAFSAYTWPQFLAFLGLLTLGQLAARISQRMEHQIQAMHHREALAALLLLLGRALSRSTDFHQVGRALGEHLDWALGMKAWLLMPSDPETWQIYPSETEAPQSPSPAQLLPRLNPSVPRPNPLEPFYEAPYSYLLLGSEGVLRVGSDPAAPVPEPDWEFLQAAAVHGIQALDRLKWLEAAQTASLATATERMRNSLLSAISHDLRTPLAAIQGASSSLILHAEAMDQDVRTDMLQMIHDESRHLAQLLGNLLHLTRLENGNVQIDREWHPLEELLGVAIRRVETAMGPLDVRIDLAEDLPMMHVDGVLIEQLLLNLLSNAKRHAPESPVDMKAWEEESSIELSIADQGPGIPPELQQRVFDKFFRLPGRGQDGGAGLGLAICDAIARVHGGRIWVENQAEKGACFRISLPIDLPSPSLPEAEDPLP